MHSQLGFCLLQLLSCNLFFQPFSMSFEHWLKKQHSNRTRHVWLCHMVKCYFCSLWWFLICKPHFMPVSMWLLLIFHPSVFLPCYSCAWIPWQLLPEITLEQGKQLEMPTTLTMHGFRHFTAPNTERIFLCSFFALLAHGSQFSLSKCQ